MGRSQKDANTNADSESKVFAVTKTDAEWKAELTEMRGDIKLVKA